MNTIARYFDSGPPTPFRFLPNHDRLKLINAGIELDDTHDLGPRPRMDQEDVQERFVFALHDLRLLSGSVSAI